MIEGKIKRAPHQTVFVWVQHLDSGGWISNGVSGPDVLRATVSDPQLVCDAQLATPFFLSHALELTGLLHKQGIMATAYIALR